MGELVIRDGLIINTTPSSGAGDPLLTRDASTGAVGEVGSALSSSLNSGQILVGNNLNVATAVTPTGDVTISNTGVTAIGSGVIVNADVNASAAIAVTKLAAVTASRALVSDGSGFIAVSPTTSTELGYVSGVTSAIQTQLNGKQATITGGATTITSSDLTINRALISNGSGKVAVSSVTNTELGFVSGVTSALQTQIDGKLSVTLAGAADGDILRRSGGVWTNYGIGTAGQILTVVGGQPTWAAAAGSGTLPTGGTTNQYLKKNSGTNFDTSWDTLTASDITDLVVTSGELNAFAGGLATDYLYVGNGSNIPTATTDLPANTTIGGSTIYRQGGGDVSLADGGTGASLTDPNADRIFFWDDSAGTAEWLQVGANLSITGTTLNASGGLSGLTTNRIPYATSATTLGDDNALTWDATNNVLSVGVSTPIRIHTGANTTSTIIGANTNITASGNANTIIGNAAVNITTGAGNTIIGGAGAAGALTTGSNNILIGQNTNLPSGTGSNQLVIQNIIFGTNNAATGTSIDNNGAIGIGTSSPQRRLHVESTSGNAFLRVNAPTGQDAVLELTSNNSNTSGQFWWMRKNSSHTLTFYNGFDRVAIDGSGRVMAGYTSTLSIGGSNHTFQSTEGAQGLSYSALRGDNTNIGPTMSFAKSRNAAPGSFTIVQNDDILGEISFSGDDGTSYNSRGVIIRAMVDGTPGASDMPGRLAFYTSTDGAASPQERMRITNTGNVLVGSGLTRTYITVNPRIQVEGQLAGTSMIAVTRNSNDTAGSYLTVGKSRGVTEGAVTIVQNGDVVGNVDFSGTDGTTAITAARIRTEIDGSPGTNDMPGRLIFMTTPDGSATPTEKVRISSIGGLFISNTASPGTPTGGATIYAASGELHSIDTAGNDQVFSPHKFDLIERSEEMAWSHWTQRTDGNRKITINCDMAAVIRAVEELTGKQFIYIDEEIIVKKL